MDNDNDRAFQAHIAEFSAVRDEINIHLNHQNELINFAIAIIIGSASLFVIGQPNIARQEPFLLLIASLLMSGLSWSFMEASLMINNLGRYVHEKLAPKIQLTVGDTSEEQYQVLGWEEAKIDHPPTRAIMHGITSTGKFSIAYVPSVALLVVFYSMSNPSVKPWTLAETVLFWTALLAVLVLPIGGLINVPFLMRFNRQTLRLKTDGLITTSFLSKFKTKVSQLRQKEKRVEKKDDH